MNIGQNLIYQVLAIKDSESNIAQGHTVPRISQVISTCIIFGCRGNPRYGLDILSPLCHGATCISYKSGVSGNSRSRPFPGIPASDSRSRKLGMIFSFPFPFPKVGNAISHSHSRSQNLGMQFSIPVPVTGNGLPRRE